MLRRVEAFVTVWETDYVERGVCVFSIELEGWLGVGGKEVRLLTPMFPLARSRVLMTPSITWLMLRTPSSSRARAAARTSSASKGCFSLEEAGPGVGVFGVIGVFDLEGRSEGLMGEENSSEGSTSLGSMLYVWQ